MLRASASSIKLTNLYGAPTGDTYHPSTPFANLIEIDGVRILLDCGWNDEFDVNFLDALMPYLGDVHAVLFSTPELVSCGALPFVMEHIPTGTCVAAAGSTAKMGLHGVLHPFLYLFPNVKTWRLENGLDFEMTVDKVYSAFRSVTEPYGGKVTIRHRDAEVECYPIFSGRMLGGHGWLIKYKIDELFYCPDFSLKPSYALKRFLPPTTSTLLFIDGSPFHLSGNTGRKYEEQLNALIREILGTLRNGKDVLIPVSVVGRGLEILTIVTHLLTEKGGDNYTVVFASIQAAELVAKASTMTEALLDEIILSERQLFANVVTCKTAEEVLSVAGPKICIADGETLDYGVSAELLGHFLQADADERENLVVLTGAPKPHTNAFTMAAAKKGDAIDLRYTIRSPLGKEELEEYYLQIELEMEEQRKALEGGAYEVASLEDENSDNDNDAGKEDEKQLRVTQQCTPGLVLPSYMSFVSKHLQFPILETAASLANAMFKKVDYAYGLPISEEMQFLMRRKAPARIYSDEGPEGIQMHNDAQAEANIPSKTFVNTAVVSKNSRVFMTDLSGFADAAIMRSLLKSRFSFAKKIVLIRGTVDDHRALYQFCRSEKVMKCGENVFFPRTQRTHLELATHVYSYMVQLDPTLANALPSALRRVKESRSSGFWDVGWVDGALESSFVSLTPEDDERQSVKRLRAEGNDGEIKDGVFTLVPLFGERAQQCARERELRGMQRGLFYVGDVDLHRLRDVARSEMGLRGEFHKNAPMLVFDAGLCVRKSANGNFSLSSMISPSVFALRKTVYGQFSQTL
ncbi:cleavage and polyadenylation specificity factor, putative [Trypanosoma cruzi]|uniref:Cleavage and polyadenylation specificity factor subunit 2 n=2 Tax=Trypanosoma cruzi TaxID=5693 RepID=Q4DR37_TRYCC|nr:cleavage and polyadenylation specificity factor, putative [Trypanosoma cruzi]AAT75334.1 cleavage polyadenylation specificity factor CPSF100 [Trypanosoma cruzi]EAN94989.1 cleavage and polyadenylation specificity factor, putative [Trypanosoma cruzi]|eukprot:XP_816840.1 cleavage and polyadenylation specificity factor [Trypanosoma cruzi strain CL Brener]